MQCELTDFMYPLIADIYYPLVDQGPYGNVKKTWVLNKTIACNFSTGGAAMKEEVKPNVNITQDIILIGRVKEDVRISNSEDKNAVTNVLITNIRDRWETPIYLETAGPRAGKSTLYEVASNEPAIGPFGSVEYYKLTVRRSENQASDI
jgi:hypothetical protein